MEYLIIFKSDQSKYACLEILIEIQYSMKTNKCPDYLILVADIIKIIGTMILELKNWAQDLETRKFQLKKQ